MKFSNVLYFVLGAYLGMLITLVTFTFCFINNKIFSAPFTDKVYICAEVIK